jgi:hypothetical protein
MLCGLGGGHALHDLQGWLLLTTDAKRTDRVANRECTVPDVITARDVHE